MNVDTNKYGYLYKITNLNNGKTYIGKHKIKLNEDWLNYMGSGRLIVSAIAKYGLDLFKKELIEYCDTEQELAEKELKLITQYKENNKAEYNLYFGDTSKINWNGFQNIDSSILDLYFEEKLSTREIALKLQCSQPTVLKYLSSFRDKDPRFKHIKQGKGTKEHRLSAESVKKVLKHVVNWQKLIVPVVIKIFIPQIIIITIIPVPLSLDAVYAVRNYQKEAVNFVRLIFNRVRSH